MELGERRAVDLLPNYRKWKRGQVPSPVGVWDYLGHRGDFELAFAFGKLFWPDFVEVEGCVLLEEQYDETSFRTWQREFEGDCARVEAMMNHVHVYDLFPEVPADHLDAQLFERLGRLLVQTWTHALKEAFPARAFNVTYSNEPQAYGPTVGFHQVIV